MKRKITAMLLTLALALPAAAFGAEDDTVTRIDFLSQVMETAGITERLYEDSFDDVTYTDPYSDIVGGAVEAQVIDAGGDFRPKDPITFDEALTMAARALNYMLLSPGTGKHRIAVSLPSDGSSDGPIAPWKAQEIAETVARYYDITPFDTGDFWNDEMLNGIKKGMDKIEDPKFKETVLTNYESGLEKLRQRNSEDEIKRGWEEIELAYGALDHNSPYTKPGVPLYDDNGGLIQAHGGGMLWDEKTQKYYWYGEARETSNIPEHLKKYADWGWRIGVACYSSPDLHSWTYEGLALELLLNDGNSLEFPKSDIAIGAVIERPKVLYNEKTGKYVMWMHIDSGDYGYARAGVAVGDTPVGPFEYVNSYRPNGKMSRDMTVFADDDGSAYLYSASDWNVTMYCTKLTDDWLGVTEEQTKMFENMSREAPAVFKREGKYYIITSGCTGWDPNEASYAVADDPMGPWTVMGNPCVGEGADLTFGGQSCWVQPIDAGDGKFLYMFMADIWKPAHHSESGYIWLPIDFYGDGKIAIDYSPVWSVEAELADMAKNKYLKDTPENLYLNGEAAMPRNFVLVSEGKEYAATAEWDKAEAPLGHSSNVAEIYAVTNTLAVLPAELELEYYTYRPEVYYIPKNTVYFADCGAENDSEYLVAEKLALNLSNSVPDQEYGLDPVTGKSWGYSSKGYCGGRDDANMFRSVRYSDTPAVYTGPDAGLTYRFEVEPDAAYSVYVGLCDPWNNGGRVMDISVNGVSVAEGVSAPNTEKIVGKRGFVSSDGVLDVTARRAEGAADDSHDPLISWIMVEKDEGPYTYRLPAVQNVLPAAEEPAEEPEPTVYRSVSLAGEDRALNYTADGVMSLAQYNGGQNQQWTFSRYVDGSYVIAARTEAVAGDKTEVRCIDVLNGSQDPGTGIITYRIYATANQRWIPEKQADGSYLLKSASSGLYLTEKDGAFTQEHAGADGNQRWIIKTEK